VQKPCPLQSERPTSQGYWTFSQSKCHSMFKRDLKETSYIYLLSRPRFHSEIIWVGYRRIVIFSLIRNNSNFPVFQATEQITKYTQSCLEIMRKYAPKMKEKAFLSILNQNFRGGACPRKLGPYGPKLHALWVCSVLPFRCHACNYHCNGCTKFYWQWVPTSLIIFVCLVSPSWGKFFFY